MLINGLLFNYYVNIIGGKDVKREMLKRILATTMASVFIINGLTITKIDAFADVNEEVSISIPQLSQVPESVETNEGVLKITSSINLKGQDVADEDAIRILKEFLIANDITINETYDESSTTLIIGELEDDIKEMDEAKEKIGISGTEGLKEEGYILAHFTIWIRFSPIFSVIWIILWSINISIHFIITIKLYLI